MAAFRHLGLLKFILLTVGAILHHPTKFCDDPSNRSIYLERFDIYRDFCDFQHSGRPWISWILDIQKFEILVAVSL